jgi:hypothetical protein
VPEDQDWGSGLDDRFGRPIAWAVRKLRLAVNLEIRSWDRAGSAVWLKGE